MVYFHNGMQDEITIWIYSNEFCYKQYVAMLPDHILFILEMLVAIISTPKKRKVRTVSIRCCRETVRLLPSLGVCRNNYY